MALITLGTGIRAAEHCQVTDVLVLLFTEDGGHASLSSGWRPCISQLTHPWYILLHKEIELYFAHLVYYTEEMKYAKYLEQ